MGAGEPSKLSPRGYGPYEVAFGVGLLFCAFIVTLGVSEMATNPAHRWLQSNLLAEGDALLERGDALGALREYRQLDQIMRDNPLALSRLLQALTAVGDVAGEVEVRRRMLELSPSAAAQRDLAGALLRAGRLAEAASSFESALRLEPDSAAAWAGRGEALAKQGRRPEAITAYRRGLELAPGNPVIQNGLGIALAEDGRIAEALPYFRAAAAASRDPAMIGNLRRAEARLLEARP